MIKKYPWHFIFLIFVIICLANIFQKLQWTFPTDNIKWRESVDGLVCIKSPKNSPLKEGDTLLTVNKYIINSQIDLNRAIKLTKRKFCIYEIEREGILNNKFIDIIHKHTPLSYYILVFIGIIIIILTLRILNASLIQKSRFSPPSIFYLLSLSFSGFLIYSPTGAFNASDFLFLSLDRISFIFFPALLVHFSFILPIKSRILRKIKPKYLYLFIYTVPAFILIFYL